MNADRSEESCFCSPVVQYFKSIFGGGQSNEKNPIIIATNNDDISNNEKIPTRDIENSSSPSKTIIRDAASMSSIADHVYVTYNGDEDNSNPINNILAFHKNHGHQVGPKDGVLDKQSLYGHYQLDKLRDMTRGPDGHLYVVVGAQSMSKILRFNGTPNDNGQHTFMNVFIDESMYKEFTRTKKGKKKSKGAHPYQMIFSSDGNTVYVSNQNTRDVRLFDGSTGKALVDGRISGFEDVRGIALYEKADMLLVASKKGGVHLLKRGDTDASKGQNLKSAQYDPQGLLHSAVPLLIRDDILYIGNQPKKEDKGGGNILYVDLSKGSDASVEVFINNKEEPTFDCPSGLTFSPDGRFFYVNSRKGLQTIRYQVNEDRTSTQVGEVFIEHDDNPLFLWHPE